MNAILTNFKDLRFWFDNQPHSMWVLYRGFHDRKSSSFILTRNESITERNKSFDLLKQMIEVNTKKNPNAEFTVLSKPDVKSNTGFTAFYQQSIPTQSTSSINGYPSSNVTPMINGQPLSLYEANIRADERSKVETEHRIQNLEARLDAKNAPATFGDKIGEMLPKSNDELVSLLMGIKGLLSGETVPSKATNISSQGFDENDQVNNQQATPSTQTQFQYDTQRVTIALENLRKIFPDIHEFLDELSNYAVNNRGNATLLRMGLKNPQILNSKINQNQGGSSA